MKLIDLLQTASSNMLRARARTLLTIVAIFIGATTITLTNGIGSGVKSYLDQQLGDLGASNVLFIQLTSATTTSASAPARYTYDPNSVVSSGGLGQEQTMMTSKDLATIKERSPTSPASSPITRLPRITLLAPATSTGLLSRRHSVRGRRRWSRVAG
jgi:putative ABC transport system permease protein